VKSFPCGDPTYRAVASYSATGGRRRARGSCTGRRLRVPGHHRGVPESVRKKIAGLVAPSSVAGPCTPRGLGEIHPIEHRSGRFDSAWRRGNPRRRCARAAKDIGGGDADGARINAHRTQSGRMAPSAFQVQDVGDLRVVVTHDQKLIVSGSSPCASVCCRCASWEAGMICCVAMS